MFLHFCFKFKFFLGNFGSWYNGTLFKIKQHHSQNSILLSDRVAESEGDK